MTIDERANTEYPDASDADNFLPIREGYLVVILRDAFKKGATEQKKIDIDKVCADNVINSLAKVMLDPTISCKSKSVLARVILTQAMEE